MKTQMDQGIFGYCGAEVHVSKLLLNSENSGAAHALEMAEQLGRVIGSQALPSTTDTENLRNRAQSGPSLR
jgi:NAD(P)H dehydrogenase (quinone)